jgi:hypothetical protein
VIIDRLTRAGLMLPPIRPRLRGVVAHIARCCRRRPRIIIGCVRLSMKSRAALQHRTTAQQDVTSRFACNPRTKMQ